MRIYHFTGLQYCVVQTGVSQVVPAHISERFSTQLVTTSFHAHVALLLRTIITITARRTFEILEKYLQPESQTTDDTILNNHLNS